MTTKPTYGEHLGSNLSSRGRIRPDLGPRLFRHRFRVDAALRAVALAKNEIRRGGTHSVAGGLSGGRRAQKHRSGDRHCDHRARMGWLARVEHAAAALVALAVLRHHCVVDRLLDRLSSVALA